ncbi:MAG: DUF933 domain-containing protein [Candidatus Omnitrophota bacterium]
MKIGLIGYSGSGKTALSTLLSGKKIESFDPFQPAVVTVKLKDSRLERLAEIVKPKKVTPPEVLLFDFKGVPKGAGFDEKELVWLLEVDVILLVADWFSEGSMPADDLASLQLELVFRDIERLAGVEEKRQAEIKQNRRKANPREDAALAKGRAWLEKERPLRSLEMSREERQFLVSLGPVTAKKTLVLVNGNREPAGVGDFGLPGCWLDAGAAEANAGEIAAFWRFVLEAAGLNTFYTAGEKDTRAWLLPAGATALEAAGQIHSDIARGFIRAEVVNFKDYDRLGSDAACRKEGVLRLEGKEYPVADGDIINIRFSP